MRRFLRLSLSGQRIYVDADAIEALTEESDGDQHWTLIDLTNSTVAVDQSASDILSKMSAQILE